MRRVCVFLGSSFGSDPVFCQMAKDIGRAIAQRGMGLVYGGASVGCMGAVAQAAMDAGGEVVGVIPQALEDKEVAKKDLNEIHVVGSMHDRKAMMAELSDGFVTLPGGLGTMEELFEVLTWAQLGFHCKPIGLLNVGGYYDGIFSFLDAAVAQGFIRPEHRDLLLQAGTPDGLLDLLAGFKPQHIPKWIQRDEL